MLPVWWSGGLWCENNREKCEHNHWGSYCHWSGNSNSNVNFMPTAILWLCKSAHVYMCMATQLTFSWKLVFLSHSSFCFEAAVALEAFSPDILVMEDTYLVHLTATVDALYHPVGWGRERYSVNCRALHHTYVNPSYTHLRLILNGVIHHFTEGRFVYNSGSLGIFHNSDSIPWDLTKTLWTVDIPAGDSTRWHCEGVKKETKSLSA